MKDCTYLFIEVCDKKKFYFIQGNYDKEQNIYIPPMIMLIKQKETKDE